jgi:hypothetical protein
MSLYPIKFPGTFINYFNPIDRFKVTFRLFSLVVHTIFEQRVLIIVEFTLSTTLSDPYDEIFTFE